MWQYEKKLQYPIKVKNPNAKLAQVIISQYGGPDGELGASLRYLSQRFTMPYPELKGLLTGIGTCVSAFDFSQIGSIVFDTENRHFSGKMFKYKSIVFLSTITILSKICL